MILLDHVGSSSSVYHECDLLDPVMGANILAAFSAASCAFLKPMINAHLYTISERRILLGS